MPEILGVFSGRIPNFRSRGRIATGVVSASKMNLGGDVVGFL